MAFAPKVTLKGPQEGEGPEVNYLLMQNMPIEYANALRRGLHADATTMCIDKVLFDVNNTACTEEYLAHRLGMIPIHVDKEAFDRFSSFYECENMNEHSSFVISDAATYCTRCMEYCWLDVKNEGDEIITVTDRDIKFRNNSFQCFSDHNNTRAGVPIVRLGKNQQIKFHALILKARGRVHAKWSPVAACPLRPRVQLDTSLMQRLLEIEQTSQAASAYLDRVCCRNVFAISEGRLTIVRHDQCILCDDCHRIPLVVEQYDGPDLEFPFVVDRQKKILRLPNPVSLVVSDTEFTLKVESTGVYSPQEALLNTIESLKDDLVQIAKMADFDRMGAEQQDNIEDDQLGIFHE